MTSIIWFRRDLRLRDHPALRTAADHGEVLGLFVLDPALWGNAGPARRAWLAATLRSLDESMGGRLCVRVGTPASLVPLMAERVGADQVHVTNDFTPYGRARDRAVVEALPDGVEGVATGTPYAVAPGTVVNGSGSPYKVFTPYSKAWRSQGWDDPLPAPRKVAWVESEDDQRVGTAPRRGDTNASRSSRISSGGITATNIRVMAPPSHPPRQAEGSCSTIRLGIRAPISSSDTARPAEARKTSCSAGSRTPAATCSSPAAERPSRSRTTPLAMAPKAATPRALPSERANMLVPVTTPRCCQETVDWAAM